jgi:hypothetical protein
MLTAGILSLVTLLAPALSADGATAPVEADASGQQGNRGRSGKRGFMVRRRPPPGYNQAPFYNTERLLSIGSKIQDDKVVLDTQCTKKDGGVDIVDQ